MKEDWRGYIEEQIYIKGHTKESFANLIGVTPVSIYAIISGKIKRPSPRITTLIADGLGLDPCELRKMIIAQEVA